MSKRIDKPIKPPIVHTLIIEDVHTAWEKMYWDIDVFGDIQRSYPDEKQPLAYAALNACISASSLENWSLAQWKKQCRMRNDKPEERYFDNLLKTTIPSQGLCVDVANTTKHGNHRDRRGGDAELTLKFDEPSEHTPPGFVVRKSNNGEISLLYNNLYHLPTHWWTFLQKVDLVSGEQPTPNWWATKISGLFDRT